MSPYELPVYQQREKILKALETHQVVVVESPTGSGKTTQLPVILHEAGYARNGIIGVTQPRRIAVLSVSDFIARQMKVRIPTLVGYKMRFEDRTDSSTAIKIMTDGILLQEMKLDPLLGRYGIIMVDEAHERSLNIDFILGLLKRVLEARPEFKVIVSSATINASIFSEYFGECPIVKIETETWPVTVIYDAPAADAAARISDEAILDTIESILHRVVLERDAGDDGDVLIFLPGERAIKDCMKRLVYGPLAARLHIIPLYSRLGKDEQERVFESAPVGRIKVIISTNIAETSVTIDGISVVIDSGLAKLNYYNPRSFTASLIETPISKASCNQRKGRAGRTRPGLCYRLYPRKDFENRPLFTTEEIYRTDLSEVVLRMAELGISEFNEFEFIAKPAKSGIAGAIDVLNLLGALTPERSLSSVGEMMCKFPLLPRLSRMIVESIMRYPDALDQTLIAASFLSTMSPYVLPPGEEMEARRAHHAFRDPQGDFISYLRMFKAFSDARDKAVFCERAYLDERTMHEIVRIREQLGLIVTDMGLPIGSRGSTEDYLCAVSCGLIQFVCVRQGRGLFRSLTAENIQIHPGSVMFHENPDYMVAGEVVRTTRMYAMSVSPLSRVLVARISGSLAKALGKPDSDDPRDLRCAANARYAANARGARTGRDGRTDSTARTARALRPFVDSRDFTNNIKLGGEIFPLEKGKGNKKIAVLDWPHFKKTREQFEQDSASAASAFKGLRAVLKVASREMLRGEKLETIIRITSWLDPEADMAKAWPRGKNFDIADGDLPALLEALDHILQAVKLKDKSTALGFVALYSDASAASPDRAGRYWFKVSKGFHTALHESIASLESLADTMDDSISDAQKERVGLLYRKLSSLL